MANTTWEVGERVAYYHPHGRDPAGVFKIEKIHKNGNIVVNGRRFRTYGDFARETGDGYAKASLRKMTPAVEAEVKKIVRRRKIEAVIKKIQTAASEDLSDEIMEALEAVAAKLQGTKMTPHQDTTVDSVG